jgi:uncharacterized protein (DUF488 family)
MTPKVAYTLGYEGSDPDEIVGIARAAGVTLVLDTRRHPTSRRPAFRREALRNRLALDGLRYESRPALGVPRRVRPLARRRRWMFEAAYRGVLDRARRSGEMDETVSAIKRETVALLCYEAEPGQCHRSLLAEAITASAPVTFIDLRVGRIKNAADHPRVRMGTVRAENKVQVGRG